MAFEKEMIKIPICLTEKMKNTMQTNASLLTGRAWTLVRYRLGMTMPNSGFLFIGESSLFPRLVNGFGTIGRVLFAKDFPSKVFFMFLFVRKKSSIFGIYEEELSARFHLCSICGTLPRGVFRSQSVGRYTQEFRGQVRYKRFYFGSSEVFDDEYIS
jgi:hypothetical protein